MNIFFPIRYNRGPTKFVAAIFTETEFGRTTMQKPSTCKKHWGVERWACTWRTRKTASKWGGDLRTEGESPGALKHWWGGEEGEFSWGSVVARPPVPLTKGQEFWGTLANQGCGGSATLDGKNGNQHSVGTMKSRGSHPRLSRFIAIMGFTQLYKLLCKGYKWTWSSSGFLGLKRLF